MLDLIWLRGVLGRRKARVAAEVIGTAVAIALFVAIGTFLGAAKRTMTQSPELIQRRCGKWSRRNRACSSPIPSASRPRDP